MLALLVAGRLLVLLWKYYVRSGCKRNIEEYLGHARSKRVYFMHRYSTIAYIMIIEETQHALFWLIKDRDYYLREIWLRRTCFCSFAKSWRTSFIETRGRFPVRKWTPSYRFVNASSPGFERPESWWSRARVSRAHRVQKFLSLWIRFRIGRHDVRQIKPENRSHIPHFPGFGHLRSFFLK